MRSVRAVILDAGGVIIHPDLDWIARRCREQGLTVSRRELFEAYYRAVYALDLEQDGATPPTLAFTSLEVRVWFFDRLLHHVGVDARRREAPVDAIARAALERFPRESDIYHFCMPGTAGRLERLVRAGFLLGSASNNDDALEEQLRSVGVLHLFGALKDSGREGVAKPDPELLLRAARDLGVAPADCLFVGDVDRVDGAAARAAGMAFALLDPLDQPRPTRPLCLPDLDAIHGHFAPP
jgi:HAD superfamily hydrolase (TIGR01509 family)